MTTYQSIDLHFQGGGSDKVYHAAVQREAGMYSVVFAYGRRGSALTHGVKTKDADVEQAMKVYEKLVAEKVGKGYREVPGVSGNIFGVPAAGAPALEIPAGNRQANGALAKEQSGILPQLCNDCTEEEVEALIKDPAWGMQEKMDGVHKMIMAGSESIRGINKKGQFVPLPQELMDGYRLGCQAEKARAKRKVKSKYDSSVIFDGEQIGNVLHVFGLLELNGQDLRGHSYHETYRLLELFLHRNPHPFLAIVPLAVTAEAKQALFNKIKAEGKEGIVLKRLAARYSPGCPNSGGDHLKFKFWADASVIVLSITKGKRSVQVGVLDKKTVVPMGSVTIPANREIPAVGDIVDVKYLYAYRGGCLYQPQYRGQRDDVTRAECTINRIKFKEGRGATYGSRRKDAVAV